MFFKTTTKTFETITAGLSSMIDDLKAYAAAKENESVELYNQSRELVAKSDVAEDEAFKAYGTMKKLQDLLGVTQEADDILPDVAA